ncbi:uncharacterized protein LOC119603588 [Lucilia sericata]|uniref:uncharacterized protein LOC119603588 n=1 Tax=Lucilia sericata TaxID=13632 RepID=UPI0018A87B3F|nr:uncharacterized protein LOC119603588 [Lucilia sericata]
MTPATRTTWKCSKHTLANSNRRNDNDAELYGNFTAIEFLKELKHYDTILIMQNHNATISNVFYIHLNKVLQGNYNNTNITSASNRPGLRVLSEMVATPMCATFANCLMASLQVPVLQLNELQSFYLKRHYCEHLLSIVYIDINIEGIQMTLNDHKGLLEKLSRNLLHMTTSKVMFLLNFPLNIRRSDDDDGRGAIATKAAIIDEDVIQGVVRRLFQHCWQQKIINVVALLADYQTTRKFYSYTHFPEFRLEIKTIAANPNEQEAVYPYRLRNLKGYKLPIVIGGSDPRIIPYKTSKGKEIIGGFVGHFIEAFAKKYNCVLVQPLPFRPHKPIPSQDLIKAVRNGTVEISAGLTFPQIPFRGYTYAYEQLNGCIMIPVEANIPGYKFFTSVFKGETYLLVIAVIMIISMLLSAALYMHGYRIDYFNILCHGDCLRGILGQSFSEIMNPPKIIRFIYLEICALGMLLTTSYNSYFSTYVTRPPKEAFLNSIDSILWSGLKVVIWEPEYKELLGRAAEFQKYIPLFYVVKNYQEYLEKRDSLNNKYGYVVPTTKWIIVQQQQKMFTAPLFRQSKNFCFFNNIPMCFPVHENSIYNSLIYQLILETAQSGLTVFWSEYGFLELIEAKKLNLKDLSAKEEFRAMTIEDLQYIFTFLGDFSKILQLHSFS